MTRRPKDPLRPLTFEAKQDLESISRAKSAPAEASIRAKILLGVASGMTFTVCCPERRTQKQRCGSGSAEPLQPAGHPKP